MKRRSGPRKTAKLSEALHYQLNMYALAASAAGVGLLALAQPAGAKIVYTSAHVTLKGNQPLPLDLDHDGFIDFYLLHGYWRTSTSPNALWACHVKPIYGSSCSGDSSRAPNALNAIRMIASEGRAWGGAFRSGAKIQHGDRFRDKVPVELGLLKYASGFSNPRWYGPWVNGGKGVKNRYLGIKFKINGRFHYGWARMTVTTIQNTFTATLTGYAYETIPGKAIVAGQTKGSDDTDNSIEQPNPAALTAPTPEPATLGALAKGGPGLSIWRRKED